MVEQVKASQNDMSSGEVLSGAPGIVVLSPSMQVLHMNRQAIKLASLLGSVELNGQPSNDPTGILPPPLADMANEILKVLRSRHERSEKGQFEIRLAANGFGKPEHSRSGSAEWTWSRGCSHRAAPHGSKRQSFRESSQSRKRVLKVQHFNAFP